MMLAKRLAAALLLIAPFALLLCRAVPHKLTAFGLRKVVSHLESRRLGMEDFREIDEACRKWPENAYYHLVRALVYDRIKASSEVTENRLHNSRIVSAELRSAIELNHSDATLYQNLGWAEYTAGNLPDAVHAFEQALEVDPSSAQSHLSLSLTHRAMGHRHDYENELAEAVRWSPSLVDSPILGEMKRECPDTYDNATASAISSLENSLARQADPAEQARLSKLYLVRGDASRARLLATKALAAVPNFSRPWIVLGDAEGLLGDGAEKRRDYVRATAVSLSLIDSPALVELGEMSKNEKHWRDAAAFYQSGLRHARHLSSEHAVYSRAVYGAAVTVSNDLIPEDFVRWTSPATDISALYTHLAECYRRTGNRLASLQYQELAKQAGDTDPKLEGRRLEVCPSSK